MTRVRTVVLYDRLGVRPETIEKIIHAKDGEMIPVEPREMTAFQSLAILIPDDLPQLEVIRAREQRAADVAQQAADAADALEIRDQKARAAAIRKGTATRAEQRKARSVLDGVLGDGAPALDPDDEAMRALENAALEDELDPQEQEPITT